MTQFIKALCVLAGGAWLSAVSAQESVDLSTAPIGIADLGLGTEIPSAIDLVGPEAGSAGRNRTALIRRLQCWIDGKESCSAADANDSRVRAMRRFLGQASNDRAGTVVVRFPDRTRIELRLSRVPNPEADAWDQRVYETVVLTDTVRAPGLPVVPSRPGHFEDFAYEGLPAIQAALKRLKQRL